MKMIVWSFCTQHLQIHVSNVHIFAIIPYTCTSHFSACELLRPYTPFVILEKKLIVKI